MSAGTNWEQRFFTASDGYRFGYRLYPSHIAAKADVVWLHGIQSHAGWYENSCSFLSQRGYDVSFLDRRGSGVNDLGRGDTPSYGRLRDDVGEFLAERRKANPQRPIVLLAISWGAKVATALVRYRPELADGMILVTPGFFPRVGLSFAERLGILWARITNPTRLFPIPLSDPELFTTTPRWLDYLRHDPLSLHQATARFLIESVRLDRSLRDAPGHIQLPSLLLLAGQDRIIENGRTRAFVERFAGPVTILDYPAAHHTLEFEPDPEMIFQELGDWIENRRAI